MDAITIFQNISADNLTKNMVLVPFTCCCTFRPDFGSFRSSDRPNFRVSGLPISDASSWVFPPSFDGQVEIEFSATAVVCTSGGIMGAVDRLRSGPVDIWTDHAEGIAEDFEIEIGEIVTMVKPDGQVIQLVGADR